MHRMTAEAWAEQFARLETTFPAARGRERDPGSAREYFRAIEQFDARTVEEAVTRLIGSSEFFPKVAKVLQTAHAVSRDRREAQGFGGEPPAVAESRRRWQRQSRERFFEQRDRDPVAHSKRVKFQATLTAGVLCGECHTGEPGWTPNPDCGECRGAGWDPSGGGSGVAASRVGGGLGL